MRKKRLTERENLGLPIPRLEIRYRPARKSEAGFDVVAEYGLVHEHLDGTVFVTPMGRTGVQGESCKKPAYLEPPFRDGAHIVHDMWHLNLPGFVVNGMFYQQLQVDSGSISGFQYRKMAGESLRKFKQETSSQFVKRVLAARPKPKKARKKKRVKGVLIDGGFDDIL